MPGYGTAPSPEHSLLAQPDATAVANPYNRPQGQPVGQIGNFLQNLMQGVGEGTMLPTGNWGEPQQPMALTQTLALLGATMAEPGPDFGPLVGKVFNRIGALKKPLERLAENFRGPLAEHTDVLYRETSLNELDEYLPFSFSDMTPKQVFMSNDPSLALGQGRARGVMLEFSPASLQGSVNRAKPAWEHAYTNGGAEFVATHNNQQAYQAALRSVLISKNATGNRGMARRINSMLPALERAGWQRSVLEDGSILLKKPDGSPKL